ncbi:integrator complex assembly factor WDR73-like isoform X2 [Oratosquilla oratoria]
MYNIHGTVSCMDMPSSDHLVVAASRDSKHELLELKLPDRLLEEKDAGLSNNRDFKMLSHGYSTSHIKQICATDEAVVSSERCGVNYYTIPQDKNINNIISQKCSLRQDVEFPVLGRQGTKVYSGTYNQNISINDLLSSQKSQSITSTEKEGDISVLKAQNDDLYVCLKNRNHIMKYDTRSNCWTDLVNEKSFGNMIWTMDVCINKMIACVSSQGQYYLYDQRFLKNVVQNTAIGMETNSSTHLQISFSPTTNNLIGISGFDKTLMIYDVADKSENPKPVFVHDGHRNKGADMIIMHLWHPCIEQLMFSADNQGELQAWKFRSQLCDR